MEFRELSTFRIDLASIRKAPDISIESLLQNGSRLLLHHHYQSRSPATDEQQQAEESIISGTLKINFGGAPIPLNELQHRLFSDFVFCTEILYQ